MVPLNNSTNSMYDIYNLICMTQFNLVLDYGAWVILNCLFCPDNLQLTWDVLDIISRSEPAKGSQTRVAKPYVKICSISLRPESSLIGFLSKPFVA